MKKSSSATGSKFIPIVIGTIGIVIMSLAAWLLQNGMLPMWAISSYPVLNFTFTMQLLVLPISFLAIAFMYQYNKESFTLFFRFNIISEDKDSQWKFIGPLLAIVFTLGTTLYMSIRIGEQNGLINQSFFKLLPMVLLLSATNAWSEEIFSRFVVVAGLHKKIKSGTICLISAIMFGLPHFFGTPNGISGVAMSGLLGWFLAKSVIETKSLGWALLIHFLQDVVIFGAGAMIIAGN